MTILVVANHINFILVHLNRNLSENMTSFQMFEAIVPLPCGFFCCFKALKQYHFFFVYLFILFYFQCMFCLHVHVCTMCVPDPYRIQNKAPDPPRTELQMVMKSDVRFCMSTQSTLQEPLNGWPISPIPVFLFLIFCIWPDLFPFYTL